MAKQGAYKFHPGCARAEVTSMCFADDLFVFSHGNINSVKAVKEVLDMFSEISGLEINKAKSKAYTAGMNNNETDEIVRLLGMEEGCLPVKYLGVPLSSMRLHKRDYEGLFSKIRGRINSWACRHLSYAGRLEVLRAVLYGILSYWCQLFIIPNNVIKEITKYLRNFLWSGQSEGRKAPVAWKRVCCPKEEGGLGLKDIKTWNKASFAGLIYDIVEGAADGSIWHMWVAKNYLRAADFWEVRCKQTASATWRAILSIRDEIKASFESDVGPVVLIARRGRLDVQELYNSWRNRADMVQWKGLVWLRMITPRMAFHMWKVVSGGTMTKARLCRAGIVQEDSCVLCNEGLQETESHLWFACSYSSQVLQEVLKWAKIHRRTSNIEDWLEQSKYLKGKKSLRFQLWCVCLSVVVYNIWNARNRLVFHNEQMEKSMCVRRCIIFVRNCLKVRCKANSRAERNLLAKLDIDIDVTN